MKEFIKLIENHNELFGIFYEYVEEIAHKMVSEYNSGSSHQPWKLVPANRLIMIWKNHVKDGFVKDKTGLQYIEKIMIENTARLLVNTDLAEHGSYSLEETLENYHIEDEIDDPTKFADWAIDLPNGGWRISDGLSPLIKLAVELMGETDDDKKLVIIDRMLNITHQRSDLASWFIEGGTRTLDHLKLD